MTKSTTAAAFVGLVCGSLLPSTAAFAGKDRSTGSIAVDNRRGEAIQVHVDGALVGQLPPKGSASYAASAGDHVIELRDADGAVIRTRKLAVEKGKESPVRLRAGAAGLVVKNRSGVDQVVRVSDRGGSVRHQTLAAGDAMTLRVDPGEVEIQTSRTWFGVAVDLETVALEVAPKAQKKVLLPEVTQAVMQVDNRSGGEVALFLDETALGVIEAKEVGHVTVPVGSIMLRGVYEGMGAFEREVVVDDDAGAELVVAVALGEVTAINESGESARVLVDGTSMGWMEPGESRQLKVPVGTRSIAFMSRGKVVSERSVRVRAAEAQRLVLRPLH